MNNWTKLTKEERLTILTNIAENKGIVENAIEKDYWVSMALRAIFSLPYASAFVFKGGTSLSKGWALIERFSEDIDLAIDRHYLGFSDVTTKSQRTKEAYPDEEFSLPEIVVSTVVPGRTFLEKVFLLHEEFTRPNGCTHIERITRHMYDIVKMMDKPFAIEAMNNKTLYEDIISHRKQFTAWGRLDYTTHLPQTISFVPPTHIEAVLRNDYRQMQAGFIYADAPSFDEIIEQMRELQNRFRMLQWDSNHKNRDGQTEKSIHKS